MGMRTELLILYEYPILYRAKTKPRKLTKVRSIISFGVAVGHDEYVRLFWEVKATKGLMNGHLFCCGSLVIFSWTFGYFF